MHGGEAAQSFLATKAAKDVAQLLSLPPGADVCPVLFLMNLRACLGLETLSRSIARPCRR